MINIAEETKEKMFLVTVIVLVGLIGFGLGRLSSKYQTAELNINSAIANTTDLNKIVTTKESKTAAGTSTNLKSADSSGEQNLDREAATANISAKIVGNKNSKIFHREDCPGALKMSESNKIFFDSINSAKSAGYKPAGNCPGLE